MKCPFCGDDHDMKICIPRKGNGKVYTCSVCDRNIFICEVSQKAVNEMKATENHVQ